MPILLEVGHRTARRIDRQVSKVGAAQPLELGVKVREVAPLQQRIVGEINAGRHILRAEGHLFRLGKEIVHHTVQH